MTNPRITYREKFPNIDEFLLTLGSRIKTARVGMNFTQLELAKEIECSHQQVQKFECGDQRINLIQLLRLAKILKRPITHFTDGLPLW